MDENFKNFIEQVRNAANIVEVIGSYVSLKKKGSKHWACCPFHGEKTPSFSVDENRQLFYCFGCHIGGDVFKFLEKKEGLNFVEAAKRLAERYNIPIPEREKSQADLAFEKEAQRIGEINEWADKYYVACLKHPRGLKARNYLLQRGITQEIMEAFQIGYALPGFENLVHALPGKGIKQEEILFAGLSLEGKQGQPYDKFRDRVMIPIKNPRGRIVGFGGRVIDQGEPKYLNTAETKFFNKRNLLFGFDLAQKPMREQGQAIVVEGYMDAISLHAAGLRNVVASMGTAFSEQQAGLLKRNTKEIIFCYDSDNPGRSASIRAVSLARKAGIPAKVAIVPGAKDPDEYIRQEGLEKFREVIAAAQPGLSFQIAETLRRGELGSLDGKVSVIKNILPFLVETGNEIAAMERIRELARQLTIDEGLILDEYRRAQRSRGRPVAAPEPVQQVQPISDQGNPAEELLLALLLAKPELYSLYQDRLAKLDFTTAMWQMIYKKLSGILSQGLALAALEELLSPEEDSGVTGLKMLDLPQDKEEEVFRDCLRELEIQQLEKKYALHAALAAEYEKAGDGRVMNELKLCQEIRNEIKTIHQ